MDKLNMKNNLATKYEQTQKFIYPLKVIIF